MGTYLDNDTAAHQFAIIVSNANSITIHKYRWFH